MRFRLVVDGESHDVEVDPGPRGLTVRVDDAEYRARVSAGPDEIRVRLGASRHRIVIRGSEVFLDGLPHAVVAEGLEEDAGGMSASSVSHGPTTVEVRPPMPGRVVKLPVAVGAVVKRGQTLAVLEAMKMQNEIPAPADATLKELRVQEGETITAERVLAVLETRARPTS